MAIFVHCPNCNQQLENMRHTCAHCGAELPPGVLHALSMALGRTPTPSAQMPEGRVPTHLTGLSATVPTSRPNTQPPAAHSPLRPWLAAALSLVCGLGQLYNGQIIKGVVLIALGAVTLLNSQFLFGQVAAPAIWAYAIVDAYLVARRAVSRTHASSSG